MIEMRNITKYYGDGSSSMVKALNGVSLNIERGEMVAIVGASGSGKSTLLNIIGCIDKQTGGEYRIDGRPANECSNRDLANLRNEVFGFVMQDFAVVPDWSVYQNVQLPLLYAKKRRSERCKAVDDIIDRLGIYDKRNQPVCNLSGGQKQRVAIARAIINNPKVLLADEPTGALDSATGIEVLNILKEINAHGTTIVLVTHNSQLASACDRTLTLRDGELI